MSQTLQTADRTATPIVVVVCGPSCVGKTTVARLLAQRLKMDFREGDTYHPQANIDKMMAGIPLKDEDRAPWLQLLYEEVVAWSAQEGRCVVLACSALKRQYRDVLRGGAACGASPRVFFVMLTTGNLDIVQQRMTARVGHYMPPSLLTSQFSALELLDIPTEKGVLLDASAPTERVVEEAVRSVQLEMLDS